MIDETKVVWCWACSPDSEFWHGAYETREEAEAHGRIEADGYEAECGLGYVAPAHWPDVAKVAAASIDIELLLERMDEVGTDNELWSEDRALFEINGDEAEAEAALQAAFAEWARKYVKATAYTVQGEKAQPVRTEAE